MTRVLSGAADDATRRGDIAEPQSNRAGRSLHPSPIIIATQSNPTPIPTAIPRVGSNDAQYYDDRGFRYYEKAVNDYDEAIRLDPNFTNAYRNRGNAFKAQGENEKADADFGKAAQVGSSH